MIVLVAVVSACVCGVVGFWLRGLCPFSCWWGVGLDRLHPVGLVDVWVGGGFGHPRFCLVCLVGVSSFQVVCLLKVRIHQWFV